MNAIRHTALIFPLLLLALTHTGCFTMMGAGIDKIVDNARPDQFETVPGWQEEGFEPGMLVTLTLRDSTRITGRYAGLEQQTSEHTPDAMPHGRPRRTERGFRRWVSR
ncbi:MAG: hypothetical protein FJY97_04940 [candidate division Zixibacteria bacterium]|nr:hypothetical protein [candidate division Zixibacteria bacterium]